MSPVETRFLPIGIGSPLRWPERYVPVQNLKGFLDSSALS